MGRFVISRRSTVESLEFKTKPPVPEAKLESIPYGNGKRTDAWMLDIPDLFAFVREQGACIVSPFWADESLFEVQIYDD